MTSTVFLQVTWWLGELCGWVILIAWWMVEKLDEPLTPPGKGGR